MKYCIIMPKLTEVDELSYQFPIGIAYVSAALKASGRKVITYNLNYKIGTIEEQIQKLVKENDIEVLATGGLTGQYWQLKKILDAAKAVRPDMLLCVGGGIITSSPVPAMEALEVADIGMIGEGEITICELAEALEGLRDLHSVDGLIFKENGSWTVTAPRSEIMDLDSLPYPDYEGFEYGEMLKRKPTDVFSHIEDRFGAVSLGRSCPFNCTFCFHPLGTKYRRRSMKSVFEEIDYLIEKFDIHNLYISDELFVAKIDDAREFCREIKKRHIGFTVYLRVDMVNREVLELLRDHGCIQICFGLESADNRILKSMNKRITIEQTERALTLCNEVGIRTWGNFIFGDEAETVETYQNTIRWWKEHPQYTIMNNLIVLYPGSILYKHACERGIIKDEVQFIKDGCPYTNVSRMTDEEYRNMALELCMLPEGRTDVLKDITLQYKGAGKVDCTARCPHCNQYNTWKSQDVFKVSTNIVCSHCGYTMHVMIADSLDRCADENFQLLRLHKVAIWPMINAVEELRHTVPSIMSDNVFFIDSAPVKQGLYHGKKVYGPKIIKDEQIDTVFLTLTTYVAAEIMEDLKKYPSVRNVFYAGDLLDPDFPKRIKE